MSTDNQVNSNDNATRRVPDNEKKSLLDITFVTAGFCICMSGLFTGATMAMGLTLKQAIIAAAVGNAILAIYSGTIGAIGAKEGVSTSILARYGFGREGSKIIGLTVAITLAGWYSVQVGFFGETISAMFPNAGFIVNKQVAAFWGGILMLITAYYGYKGLSILSYIAVPAIAILSTIGIFASVNSAGGWSILSSINPSQTITIGSAIVMVVGSFAVGGAAQSDITRYAKSPKDAWIATGLGYMGANLFIIMAGFITQAATGAGDLPSAMLKLGLGIPGLIVLIAAQWTTNDNNLYSSSLGISNAINVKKSKIVLAVGILATIVGAAGLSNYFTNWLIILGIGAPPMAGIIIGDYFFIKNQQYNFDKGAEYCNWNVNAFISWGLACLVGYFVKWGIGSINSLIVGLVTYVILMKAAKASNFGLVGKYVEESV